MLDRVTPLWHNDPVRESTDNGGAITVNYRPALADDGTVLETVLLDSRGAGDVGVTLAAEPGGGYTLAWYGIDNVLSDGKEHFPKLAAALARLAVLAHLAEGDWTECFHDDAEVFAADWDKFATAVVW